VIDGVTVLWAERPPPLTATLTFGCGVRDESFMSIGVTHLIEHLAMSRLPRLHHEHNASVDLETTDFYATGRPEQVVAFLRQVCEALSDLPLERLATEAGVLDAEGGNATHPTAACLLARRYGIRGPGLELWAGPGYDAVTPDAVRAHAGRFFVAGNAVLQLTGPPPADLRLPLPPGPLASHPAPPAREQTRPLWSPEPAAAGIGLSLVGGRQEGWFVGMQVLAERLTQRARHDRGLSYEIGWESTLLDRGRVDRMIMVDARDGHEATVAGMLWEEVRRLADEGPTAEELKHERESIREMHADPRSVEGELGYVANAELFGLEATASDERQAIVDRLTPTDIAELFEDALPTALLVVPEDVRLELPGVSVGGCSTGRTVPAGTSFRPPAMAKLLHRAARAQQLILTADGVAHVDEDGDVHRVRFADVVGVQVDEDGRVLFGANGCIIPVDKSMFRGAEAAIRAVDAATPPTLHFTPSPPP